MNGLRPVFLWIGWRRDGLPYGGACCRRYMTSSAKSRSRMTRLKRGSIWCPGSRVTVLAGRGTRVAGMCPTKYGRQKPAAIGRLHLEREIMKRLAILGAVLALAACATTTVSPAHYYRAAGDAGQLEISGTVVRSHTFSATGYAHEVALAVNGTEVARGDMGGGNSLDLRGDYQGRKIDAACGVLAGASFTDYRPYVRCMVFVNGERAANLDLKP